MDQPSSDLASFWVHAWPSVIVGLVITGAVWAVSLYFVVLSSLPANRSYTLSWWESVLTHAPKPLRGSLTRPQPAVSAGGSLQSLRERYGHSMLQAEQAMSVRFSLPAFAGSVLCLVGILQALLTLCCPLEVVGAWNLVSLGILALSVSAFLITFIAHGWAWQRRMPFEWRFLAVANQASLRIYTQHSPRWWNAGDDWELSLDPVQRVLVSRFDVKHSPSNELSNLVWNSRLLSLLTVRSSLDFLPAGDARLAAARDWIELSADELSAPLSIPNTQSKKLRKQLGQRLGADLIKDRRSGEWRLGLIGVFVTTALAIVLFVAFAIVTNARGSGSFDIGDALNAWPDWAQGVAAVVAVLAFLLAGRASRR